MKEGADGGADPTVDPKNEDTSELCYEWVVDEYSSDEVKTLNGTQRPSEYRGFCLKKNNGNFFYVPQGGSPDQSSIDFLGATPRLQNVAHAQRYPRAFDFSKSFREVGDVRPLLGCQTQHWVGMPQISLNKYITEEDLELLSKGLTSNYSLESEGHIPLGAGVDVLKRPPSPPSSTGIADHAPQLESISNTSTIARTRYSIETDGLNPFHLVGEDTNGTQDKLTASNVATAHSEQKVQVLQGIFSYPEQIEQPSAPPLQSESRTAHRRYQQPENVAFSHFPPEWAQWPIYLPEKAYTAEELENILDEIYGRASIANSQTSPDARAGSPDNIPQAHPFFTSLPPHLGGRYPVPLSANGIPFAVPVSSQQPAYAQGAANYQATTTLANALNEQISEVESQLMSAYDSLEKSEIEKRRLVQQLSYLRLMELELVELQALTRIVNSTVPAEEDILILDGIIRKMKGPKFPPTGK